MKVYLMNYGGTCIGVYSRKKKLLQAYMKKCKKYREDIITDLQNAVQGIYRGEYDCMRDLDKNAIIEILNLFNGNEYDSSQFSFLDLSNSTHSDYSFCSMEMDS